MGFWSRVVVASSLYMSLRWAALRNAGIKTRSRNRERSSSRFWEEVGLNVGIHAT